MSKKLALLFADSTLGVGLGHISRTKALQSELESLGYEIRFFDSKDFDSVLDNFKANLKNGKVCDLIAIDSYVLELESYKKAADFSKLALFFDDFMRLPYPSGIIVNYANGADFNAYKSKYPHHILFLGSPYLLLQDSFKNAIKQNLKNPISLNQNIKKILLTLGGVDVLGLNNEICNTLLNNTTLEIHCISKNPLKAESKRLKVYYNLDSNALCELIKSVDICICACGQSLGEILACGIPAIALEVASNQRANLDSFKHCTLNLKNAYLKDKSEILTFIKNSLSAYENLSLRQEYQKAALKILSKPTKWKKLKNLQALDS
ncbi:MAG: hypothetical protein PUB96_03415 [Helicobacteraceae bacterium]|nr:hypothetical protein [Helicobacteraceae bacterium]